MMEVWLWLIIKDYALAAITGIFMKTHLEQYARSLQVVKI